MPPLYVSPSAVLHGKNSVFAAVLLATVLLVSPPLHVSEQTSTAISESPPLRTYSDAALLRLTDAPADGREYGYAVVHGVRVLCISDMAAPQAAAAVSVAAGSWADPPKLAGLAHFLEHAVFLGSERFPGENEWGSWVSARGGSFNAFTSQSETNYYFSVDSQELRGAMLRFGGFFVAPLLNASSLDREVLAVNAEHTKNLRSDGWRSWQLLKQAASPSTPMAAFSTGDAATLRVPNARANLFSFHAQHYSAPSLTAAITGPFSLAELESIIRDALAGVRSGPKRSSALAALAARTPGAFSAWADESAAALDEADSTVAAAAAAAVRLATPLHSYPFPSATSGSDGVRSSRGLLLLSTPIQPAHSLSLTWPIARFGSSYQVRAGAAGELAALLGDRGPHSLLDTLSAAGLAVGVDVGLELDAQSLGLFVVSVDLAPAAAAAVDAVAKREGAEAGAAALASLVGAVVDSIARALDVVESTVLASARSSFSLTSSRLASPKLAALALGVHDDELATDFSLDAPALHRRAAWTDAETQSALLARAENEAGRARPESDSERIWPVPENDEAARLWIEHGLTSKAAWRFPEHIEGASLVTDLASRLSTLGPQDVLLPPSLAQYAPLETLRLLRQLVPAAAVAQLVSSLVDAVKSAAPLPQVQPEGIFFLSAADRASAGPVSHALSLSHLEPVYGTRFAVVPIAAAVASLTARGGSAAGAAKAETMQLPPKNKFLPTTFSLSALHGSVEASLLNLSGAADVVPALMRSSAGTRSRIWETASLNSHLAGEKYSPPPLWALWWAPSASLGAPRAKINVRASFPSVTYAGTQTRAILSNLVASALQKALDVHSALLNAAYGYASVQLSPGGVEMDLSAFSGAPFAEAMADLLPRLLHPFSLGGLLADGARSHTRVAEALALIAQSSASSLLDSPLSRAREINAIRGGARRWSSRSLLGAAWALAEGRSTDDGSSAPRVDLGSFTVRDPVALWTAARNHWDELIVCSDLTALVSGDVDAAAATKLFDENVRTTLFNEIARARTALMGTCAGSAQAAVPADADSHVRALALSTITSLQSLPPSPRGSFYDLRPSPLSPDEENAAVIATFGAGFRDACAEGNDCVHRAAALQVLGDALAEPAFDYLRTRRSLGYIVRAGISATAGARPGVTAASSCATASAGENNAAAQCAAITVADVDEFGRVTAVSKSSAPRASDERLAIFALVQSPSTTAVGIDEAIDDFMSGEAAALFSADTASELDTLVRSLAASLAAREREAPRDILDASTRAWSSVRTSGFGFAKHADDARAFEALNGDAVRNAWHALVGADRARFSAMVQASKGSAAGGGAPQHAQAETVSD